MSEKIADGGPAFPLNHTTRIERSDGTFSNIDQSGDGGMSLRDWFAGQVVIGLLASPELEIFNDSKTIDKAKLVTTVYRIADAMIVQRNKVT